MTPFVNLTEPACRTLLFCPQRCLLSPPGRKHWIFPSNLRKRKNHIHHSRPTALLPQLSPTLTITCHCFEPISVLKLQIFRNDVQTGDNGEKERDPMTHTLPEQRLSCAAYLISRPHGSSSHRQIARKPVYSTSIKKEAFSLTEGSWTDSATGERFQSQQRAKKTSSQHIY